MQRFMNKLAHVIKTRVTVMVVCCKAVDPRSLCRAVKDGNLCDEMNQIMIFPPQNYQNQWPSGIWIWV